MIIRQVLIIFVAFFLAGCGNKEREARRAELREIMHGNTPDAEMTAAMEKARVTVGDFLAAMQKPGPGQSQFLVRKSFPAANGKKQILWVNSLTYDGTLLHGHLDDNSAQPGLGVAKDGLVSFPPSEISDWMFNDNGQAAGGWMLRVFKKKFPEEWEKGHFGEQIKSFKE